MRIPGGPGSPWGEDGLGKPSSSPEGRGKTLKKGTLAKKGTSIKKSIFREKYKCTMHIVAYFYKKRNIFCVSSFHSLLCSL
jgi:hypothetical protein